MGKLCGCNVGGIAKEMFVEGIESATYLMYFTLRASLLEIVLLNK